MACCAALTLLFAWMYRVVRWLGGASTDEEFAPAAVWPPADRPIPVRRATTGSRDLIGIALVVIGASWFLAGMLAMHVFGVLAPIHSVPADLAFHASGLWLATAGLALRFLHRPLLRSAA
jgi:hypothetical protein